MKPKPMQYVYQISPRTGKAYTQNVMTGENKLVKFCYECGAIYAPEINIEMLMEDPWYGATKEHYHKCYYCGNELSETPFNGSEEFDEDAAIKRDQIEEENLDHDIEPLERLAKSMSTQSHQPTIPICPTCGSTNIKHISTANRVVSIGMLGIFSGKIGKNYECLDCKARW